jgi:NRPS condensation-like uncharacterized protein
MKISIPKNFRCKMFDQTLYAMSSLLDPQIGLVISSDNRFNEKNLAKAIRLSLDAEPHLGCRFVPEWWEAYWERIEDLNSDIFFSTKSTSDPNDDIVKFLAEPINYLKGPQVKTLLLRGDRDILCIKVSHLAMDAWGVKEYVYLLSSIYRTLQSNPDFVPVPNLSGSRSMRQISSCFDFSGHLGIIRRGFRDLISSLFTQNPYTFPSEMAEPSGRTFVIRHFGTEISSKMLTSARLLSATINDFVMALLLNALYHVSNSADSSVLSLVVTADLRRHLPEGRKSPLSNLSGWVFPQIGSRPGNNIQDTCQLVRDVMNNLKSDYIGLGVFPLLTLTNKLLPLAWAKNIFEIISAKALEQGKVAPSFTNMGRIDDVKLDFGNIEIKEAFLLPPIVKPPYWAAGLSGYKNTLTLSSGFCSSGIEINRVERMFDHVFKEILA